MEPMAAVARMAEAEAMAMSEVVVTAVAVMDAAVMAGVGEVVEHVVHLAFETPRSQSGAAHGCHQPAST